MLFAYDYPRAPVNVLVVKIIEKNNSIISSFPSTVGIAKYDRMIQYLTPSLNVRSPGYFPVVGGFRKQNLFLMKRIM
jgi:hypothetical protein